MAEDKHRRSLEEIRRTVGDSLRSFEETGNGLGRRANMDPNEHVSSSIVPSDPPGHSEPTVHVNGKQGSDEVINGAAAERIEKIGDVSARAIMEACETTASDIEKTGQAAVDFAAEIMSEAQQLATGLRAKGLKMSEHLKEFAQLAKKVSITMRDTRKDVIGAPDAHST